MAKSCPPFRPAAQRLQGFNALAIPGCVCWTKPTASTMATDTGAAVSEASRVGYWYDQSGLGNNIEWDSSLAVNVCPTYRGSIQNGLPMVLFDGVNDFLTCNPLVGYFDGEDAALTVAIVLKKVTNSGTDTVWAAANSATTTPLWQAYTAANHGISKRDDAAILQNPSGGTTDTNAHVLIWRMNGTTVDMWDNGTQIITAGAHNVGVLTLDRFALGAKVTTTTSQYHDGYVGEFVVYENALSAANLTLLQAGLRGKWGV